LSQLLIDFLHDLSLVKVVVATNILMFDL
jgi:hypothetical protein